jgi:putative phosphoribosyl transferase
MSEPDRRLTVTIPTSGLELTGELDIPATGSGLVVFVHGSGSSRHSPRNRFVSDTLNDAHLATLLFDLLTESEARDRSNVFDIELLARRVTDAVGWLREHDAVGRLPIGLFGASTGAAAALWASVDDAEVRAVVSRGGRPDLAAPRLHRVTAPTLLIVGGRDEVVLDLNRRAAVELRCAHRVDVIPGATHLFEEPGTLGSAAGLAREWFVRHLQGDE